MGTTLILIGTAIIEMCVAIALEAASYNMEVEGQKAVFAEQLRTERIAQEKLSNADLTASENMFN